MVKKDYGCDRCLYGCGEGKDLSSSMIKPQGWAVESYVIGVKEEFTTMF